MLQIGMRRFDPNASTLRSALTVLALTLSGVAQASTPAAGQTPALGLIVGYRAAADDLAKEQTDRGPWADRRSREQAAWARAASNSRERTLKLARDSGVPVKSVSQAGRAALINLPQPLKGAALEDAMRRLRLHPDVAWVVPDEIEKRKLEPTDPLWSAQWHLKAPTTGLPGGYQPGALNLPPAWDIETGVGKPTVVAVVDSGILADHPDLANDAGAPSRLLPGYDFVSELSISNDGDGRDANPRDEGDWIDTNDLANPLFDQCDLADSSWHGTFIAGQIAARPNDAVGVAGINWGARVLPVRISGKCGARLSDLLDGVRWAAGLPVNGVPTNPTPAKVINLSFGGSGACNAAYQSLIQDVTAAGALLVVAAGNSAGPLTRPADCPGVLSVASVRRDGAKAEYSSFGANVALSAPGGSSENSGDFNTTYRPFDDTETWILAPDNAGTRQPTTHVIGYKQGTSFSAPQAAGVASLMLALNPSLTVNALTDRLKAAVRPHTSTQAAACGPANTTVCNCTTTTCGTGLLDASLAVQLARGPAAVIAPVGTVLPGALVSLNGSGSINAPGQPAIQTWTWSLVSGDPITIQPAADPARATVQLPNREGRWVFRLTVSDGSQSGTDTLTVVAANPPATGGGGGGSLGWWWGASLWAWVVAVGVARRRRSP